MKRKQWIAGIGLGVAIAGGALLVATVSPIGLAGAQDETDTVEKGGSDEETTEKHSRHGVLDEVLEELVAEGTIDQADADAVADAMQARAVDLGALAEQRLDDAQARLDQALADGSIGEERAERTQERIDAAREALENGELPSHGPGSGFGHGHRWPGSAHDGDDQ